MCCGGPVRLRVDQQVAPGVEFVGQPVLIGGGGRRFERRLPRGDQRLDLGAVEVGHRPRFFGQDGEPGRCHVGKAATHVADDIDAGKWKTVEDARVALTKAVDESMKEERRAAAVAATQQAVPGPIDISTK